MKRKKARNMPPVSAGKQAVQRSPLNARPARGGRQGRQRKAAISQIIKKGDVNSKIIFENRNLCAEFLRDYSGLEIFAGVRPEDIEPVSLRYHLFEDTELNSDFAVRVLRVQREDGLPVYAIPLIEHKSEVDFNVAMQLLYYMACIWKSWEKEMQGKGFSCKSKDFKYPMIYPIVYFEGSRSWTAGLHFAERIWQEDFMKEYTPDFKYHVVRLHDHSNDDLLKKGDVMSLAMIFNKVQHSGDIGELTKLDVSEIEKVIRDAPQEDLDVLAGIFAGLCRKLNVPQRETAEYVRKLRKDRDMGYLWANMEKMDIQKERRNTRRQTARADAAEKRADEAEARADEAKARADEAETRADEAETRADEAETRVAKAEEQNERDIAALISTLREFVPDRAEAKRRLMKDLALDEQTAEKKMGDSWP